MALPPKCAGRLLAISRNVTAASISSGAAPQSHALEHSIAPNEAVHQRRAEVDQEHREQEICEIGVQLPQPGIERRILREDGR